ncbi:GNAT family N-acetyltransferase [Cycloclasticus sp.]|uniref:GNAT family N-acetyltransferase n=1 Tax=Cycloclasticus sp. TaxID=2024830 RepID=UPI000C111F75|nr:GNAT family N-acetyltransferase [Cycloclasticus sp.]PHR50855.1 MAG: GNAT family N-acetyltransferase [Cycloclasticus sp.]
MNIKFLSSISKVSDTHWNSVFETDYPFIQHAFLSALEQSGCTQASTGWTPHHIIVTDRDDIIAAMPCYLKTHSYGEYVFDWAWANAYQQHQLHYYPKLLSAIPFTPSTGPRLAFHNRIQLTQEKQSIIKNIRQAALDSVSSVGLSSWHVLFPDTEMSSLLEDSEYKQRSGIQYHWFNHHYTSFDDFLQTFKSRKRKTLRKERLSITQQGIEMTVVDGRDISKQLMAEFYRFYHFTYLKRSGQQGYLNLEFFNLLLSTMTENLVMFCAQKDNRLIGAALCFKDHQTLYGRYWGCEQEYEFLHFEACYYQGIEYCINHKLMRFDPGAQGEHKISRGFKPVKTLSNHMILHAEFRQAIEQFIDDEKIQVNAQIDHLTSFLPFKSASL